ncbi:MAG TPA: outer membrane lipoprotein-sorting protein [Polyangiales bacterium]
MRKSAGFVTSIFAAGVLWAHGSAHALDASSTDAKAIVRAAADQQNEGSRLSRTKMTIRQGGTTRERTMTLRSKRSEDTQKALILIESPADVRNTGFLSIHYDARKHADEQYLYLPALHRTTRVPSSGSADSFVGSDFSISDLTPPEPDDYDVKLLDEHAKVGDDECWLIESLPRDEQVKAKTGYQKSQLWISKSKQLVVQIKAWSADGKKTKYFRASDVRKVDDLWTPHRLQMRTVEQGKEPSETVIDVLSVTNRSAEVTDADFSEQRLSRGL